MTKIEMINKIINSRFIYRSEFLEEKRDDFHMKITFSEHNQEVKSIYKFDVEKRNKEYKKNRNFDDDNSIELFPFFSNITNLKKISDYVIFFERADKLYILISELKKGSDNSNASKQLEATETFMKFIISSAKRLGLEFELTDADCVFYKIRFSEEKITKINKGTTRFKDPLHGLGNDTFEYRSDCLQFIHFK